MAESLSTATTVNALAQAAEAQTSSSATASSVTSATTDPLAAQPSLPQLPAPQKAPTVPTDDHGQSNVVFSDSGTDGDLVH